MKTFYRNYVVTEDGNIKNESTDKYLSISKWIDGYCYVVIDRKKYYIHRLVAQYHIENPQNKKEVNHIDGNKSNNHFSNLEWVSSSENKQHYLKNNTRSKQKSLTPEELYNIELEILLLESSIKLSNKYNLSYRRVMSIKSTILSKYKKQNS